MMALPVLAAAAGAVTALAFAPHSLALLAPIGVAGGCLAWRQAGSAALAMGLGVLFGLGLFGSVLSWSHLFGPVAYTALVSVQALFFAPVGCSAHRLSGCGQWRWTAGVAGAWTLAEAARSHVPLGGFEWAQLGYAAAGTPVMTAAGMVGVLGLTLLVAAAGAAIVPSTRPCAAACPLLVVSVALMTAGLAVLGARPWTTPVGELDVALVQIDPVCVGPSVDCSGEAAAKLERLTGATRGLDHDTDLIVWGESALRAPGSHDAGTQLSAALGVLPGPLLAGVTAPVGKDRFDNLNVLFAPTGEVLDAYRKQHPVPFGEYVPARGWLGDVADVGRLVPRDMVRGDRPGQLRLGDVRLATVSSFEATFARLVADAAEDTDLITVLTLHSSYQRTAVSDQFLAMAQLRAAEHQRAVVIASTTGRSAVIEPDGTVTAAGRLYAADVLTGPVTLRRGATPYGATGELPILATAGLLLAAARFPPTTSSRRRLPRSVGQRSGEIPQ